jgi:hypothetical protein
VLATSFRRVRGLDAQPAPAAPAAAVIPAQGGAEDGPGIGAASEVAAVEVVD